MDTNILLVPEFRELIKTENISAIKEFCSEEHPAVIAEIISPLDTDEIWKVLRFNEMDERIEIFSNLDTEIQVDIIASLGRSDAALILSEMSPDDRADLFKRLPESVQELVLPALAQAEREDIRRLTSYPEGTAGSVMTTDYATLSADITASAAIDRLREAAPDKETIYYAYIVDEKRKLKGFVSLKDLILAKKGSFVRDIMYEEAIYSFAEDDQEDAARKIQKYDLLALPVVSSDLSLLGIITHDDATDIMTQEYTEDMERLVAVAGSHEAGAYMKTTVFGHFKNRAPWLAGLAILGLVSGMIVQKFEGLLMQFTILASFMPMLADTGGNTGSQSATLVIRALALKEVTTRNIFEILWKEFRISVLLAFLLALITYFRVLMYRPDALNGGDSVLLIGAAISLALGLQVVTSTVIGALLPMLAARLKWDPAVVATPALTTVVDITGLLIYFSTVKIILGL